MRRGKETKIKFQICLIFIIVIAGFTSIIDLTSENARGTDVSGVIYDGKGGPWTPLGSPYIVVGNVTITTGHTLTIWPGVQVKFEGYYSIFVEGNLNATGTDTNKINITSNKAAPAPGDWEKIQINNSGYAEIKHTNISYGSFGLWFLESSNNNVSANNILNNEQGIYLQQSSNITMINNNFVNDGIIIKGDGPNHFNSHIIPKNNIVNGNPVYYYKNCTNISIDGILVGELILVNCTNVVVRNLKINNTDVGIEVTFSNNILVTMNNITSNNDDGIYIYASSNNNITNNKVSNNNIGVHLHSSANNNIINNKILSNNDYGIYFYDANFCNIINNNISFNYNGFYLRLSRFNVIIKNNISSNNRYGIDAYRFSGYNIVSGNTVLLNNLIGILFHFKSNYNTISSNNIWFNNLGIDIISDYNTVTNNNISQNENGFVVSVGATDNIVAGNTVSFNNDNGFIIIGTSNNITNNYVFSNKDGFYLYYPSNNIITNNNVSNNENYGFYGEHSLNNWIYHNNIINNTIQAYEDVDSSNHWNDTYPSGGNYWSDYSPICIDNFDGPTTPQTGGGGSDGICDVQYDIDILGSDYYPFSIPADTTPPTITNLQPPDGSLINNNTPQISADYWDSSGIDMDSVVLKVDNNDVTPASTVTASDVTYIPFLPLSENIHTVYLEVKDNVGNLAAAMWSFTVDTTPPTISNLQPSNGSIIINNPPTISADYWDLSGINVSSVLLEVDGLDVTSSAGILANNVTYTPLSTLTSGLHTVYLEVEDICGNLATISWTFIVDNPPTIEVWDPGGTPSQSYTQGDIITITWNATDENLFPPNPVNITYGMASVWTPISTLEANDGLYVWNTSAVPCPGSYWMNLSVYDAIGQTTFDESNYSFDIFCPGDSPPTITVYEPGGSVGQTYIQGDIITITWNANDDNLLPINPINITYGVAPIWNAIATFEMNDGSYSWNTSAVPCPGTFWMNISVYDSIGQTTSDESNYSFSINCPVTPDEPTTTIHVGVPQYSTTTKYVTSSTQIWFTVTDPSGTGYSTYYYIDTVPEIIYTGSFTIPDEGGHKIFYYSVDNLGGTEELKEFDIIVDNNPPTTIIEVGDPKHINGDTWVTSTTEITLPAIDGGLIPVGINYTEHRIWNNGSWTTWAEYSSAFTLDVDGITYLEFYSVDYLGNREITNNETYFVDNTPPTTTHILQLESDNTEARISLIANDVGSGVNYTKYRVDFGDWATYSGTFIVNESGWHTIYFWSIDRLGNAEIEKNFSVLIEESGIVVPPIDGEEELNWKPLIALIFTLILLFIGTLVSNKKSLKFIKNTKRKQVYTWMITVLPFVIAEIATGIISHLTGLLSVPPLIGPGMVVDLAILILGLLVFILIYKRFGEE